MKLFTDPDIATKQISAMLHLQDSMNQKVHPDWINQSFEWYRAIWTECAELMDHCGWKWWKKQDPDMEQVRLELVDIWHFGLSDVLADCANNKVKATNYLFSALKTTIPNDLDSIQSLTDNLAGITLEMRGFPPTTFFNLLAAVGMDLDTLYRYYVSKNVLNFFRQDNGYKEGSYLREWKGKDDNEHLIEIVNELDSTADSFAQDIYQELSNRYNKAIAA